MAKRKVTHSIERNDIDISKLFAWGKEIEIKNNAGEVLLKVYLRLVGDAELNRARVKALRASAEMRKRLRDPESDERYAYIPDLEDFDKEGILSAIMLPKLREIAIKMNKTLIFPEPSEPDSDATLEQQEDYQKLIDSYPERRTEALKKLIEIETDKEKEKIRNLSIEELKKMYETLFINNACENQMMTTFISLCTFYGTYKDPEYKVKAFETYAEFENLPSFVRDQLVDAYGGIDIDNDFLN